MEQKVLDIEYNKKQKRIKKINNMFDTHHHNTHRTEHVTKNVNITEKRAPTDLSVQLLNEFQEKAKSNIIKTIKVDSNFLKAIAIYYQDEYVSGRMAFHVKFELNGEKYSVDGYIDHFEWREEMSKSYLGFGHDAVFNAVWKKFTEMLSLELLRQTPDFINPFINRHA